MPLRGRSMGNIWKQFRCVDFFRSSIMQIFKKRQKGKLGFVQNKMIDSRECFRLRGKERATGNYLQTSLVAEVNYFSC